MRSLLARLNRLWRRRALLPALLLLARRDLAAGRHARAKARLLRSARISPGSFHVHFGLACVYLRERDFFRAERELHLAEQISPDRFRQYSKRLQNFTGSREAVHGARQAGVGGATRGVAASARSAPPGTSVHSLGDCASEEEWLKFERMGPIRPEELLELDWDRFIDSIGEEPR